MIFILEIMDLFHMKRYDEESADKEDIPQNKILEKLQNRLKTNKRKSHGEEQEEEDLKKPKVHEEDNVEPVSYTHLTLPTTPYV